MNDKSADPSQWVVGTSTALFKPFDEQGLEAVAEAGLGCMEFVVGRNDPERGVRYAPLVERARTLGVDIWSVHLPFGTNWDVSSLDAEVREYAIAGCVEIMERGVTWGALKAILHPSYEPIPDAERSDRVKLCAESLHTLAEEADRIGIQIAVECLPRTCLGNTGDEILTLLEAHPSLGVCCDVNHLLHETPEEFIAKVGSRIVTLHISDYDAVDERHWLPGEGVIDWAAVVRELVRAGYQGPWMYEVVRSKPGDETPLTPERLMTCWQEILAAQS